MLINPAIEDTRILRKKKDEVIEKWLEKAFAPMIEKWAKEFLDKHIPRWIADEYQGKMLISYEE